MESQHIPSPAIPKRVRTPLGRRLGEVLRSPGQVVIWLATGALALWMAGVPDTRQQVLGTVQGNEARLAFGRGGTIEEMLVTPGTIVSKGTLLARLDGSDLDARLAVTEHEVAAVAAELAATASAHQRVAAQRALEDRLADTEHGADDTANTTRRADALTRVEIEALELRLSALSIEVEIDTDRLSAERIGVQLARARKLSDEDVSPYAITEELELRVKELRGRIAANERLLEATRVEAREFAARAEVMREAIAGATPAPDLTPTRTALEAASAAADLATLRVIERRIQMRRAEVEVLRVQLAGLDLRSSIEGRVAVVEALAGQTVLAGTPVVTVQSQEAASVVVYLPEPVDKDESLPRSVLLARVSAPRELTEVRVLGPGTGVELIPQRLWAHPERPSYGRPLVLELPEELGLIPGEVVLARLP